MNRTDSPISLQDAIYKAGCEQAKDDKAVLQALAHDRQFGSSLFDGVQPPYWYVEPAIAVPRAS